MSDLQVVCDCPTKDAMVCRDNPECRPSYCKMTWFDGSRLKRRDTTPDPVQGHAKNCCWHQQGTSFSCTCGYSGSEPDSVGSVK